MLEIKNRKIVKFFPNLGKFNKNFQISKISFKVREKLNDFTKFKTSLSLKILIYNI